VGKHAVRPQPLFDSERAGIFLHLSKTLILLRLDDFQLDHLRLKRMVNRLPKYQ